MIPIETAYELLDENVFPMPFVDTPIAEAVGKILTRDISADVDSPPHDKSVMDGFAVRSSDINAGARKLTVVETVTAGDVPSHPVQTGEATRIMTGAPIPEGADAVVMIEQTTSEHDDVVTIELDSIAAEKHLLRKGKNFAKGQTVFQAGHKVRPTDIGLLAEVGASTVATSSLPSIAVLPTGNELVDCTEQPAVGKIRNSNGPMLIAMTQSLGLRVTNLGIGRDDAGQLRELISAGLTHDMLILSGGVSAGTKDLVPGILKELGVRQLFHKVCVKPGKPIWFGVFETDNHRTLVFGLPGNPVSSLVGFQLFVRAAINKMLGLDLTSTHDAVACELRSDHETRGNRPTYWPGALVQDEGSVRKVEPLVWNGSSDLLALGKAEGLIYFSAESQVHPAGTEVKFLPFS